MSRPVSSTALPASPLRVDRPSNEADRTHDKARPPFSLTSPECDGPLRTGCSGAGPDALVQNQMKGSWAATRPACSYCTSHRRFPMQTPTQKASSRVDGGSQSGLQHYSRRLLGVHQVTAERNFSLAV